MPAVTRVCPDCGARWRQRDARFCGRCGAALAEPAPARRRGGRARGAIRVGAAVAAVALVAALSGVDLTLPSPDAAVVEVDDDLRPSGDPLTEEEAETLRAQADPDRLRCEPRGCELWRIERRLPVAGTGGEGVVALADDLVVVLGSPTPVTDVDDHGEGTVERNGHTVVAVDPRTGEQPWSRQVLHGADDDAVTWARLLPAPDGALLLAGGTVTSIDRDGAVPWQWHLTAPDQRGEVWNVVPIGDVLLVDGIVTPGGASERRVVAALDVATGEVVWSADVADVAHLDDEVVIVLEGDRYRSLDPATGAPRWERTDLVPQPGWMHRAGHWLMLVQEGAGQVVLDPDTGDSVARIEGHLAAQPAVEDAWLALVVADVVPWEQDPDAPGEAAGMRVVVIAPDGAVAWTVDLGTIDPWWTCCTVDFDGDVVAIGSERFHRAFDRDTGELRRAEPNRTGFLRNDWSPVPGVEVRWHDDGRGMTVTTDDGEATVRGGRHLMVDSWDPLIVSDDRHLIAVRAAGDD